MNWCEVRWSDREDGAADWANVSWCCKEMLTLWASLVIQLIDCLIWPYPTCLWKICSNDFEPEYPPTYLFHKLLLLTVLMLFSGRGGKVCPFSDLPFFSSPPRGLCNAGGLTADVPYAHLDTKDATYLLGTRLKAPRKTPECSGTLLTQWKVCWIKVTQQGAAVWTTVFLQLFFFHLPTNHTLRKSFMLLFPLVFCF